MDILGEQCGSCAPHRSSSSSCLTPMSTSLNWPDCWAMWMKGRTRDRSGNGPGSTLNGDHEWTSNDSRPQALHAYTAALATSAGLGIDTMLQVGAHTINRLLRLPAADFPKRVDAFDRSLQRWIRDQMETDDKSVAT